MKNLLFAGLLMGVTGHVQVENWVLFGKDIHARANVYLDTANILPMHRQIIAFTVRYQLPLPLPTPNKKGFYASKRIRMLIDCKHYTQAEQRTWWFDLNGRLIQELKRIGQQLVFLPVSHPSIEESEIKFLCGNTAESDKHGLQSAAH